MNDRGFRFYSGRCFENVNEFILKSSRYHNEGYINKNMNLSSPYFVPTVLNVIFLNFSPFWLTELQLSTLPTISCFQWQKDIAKYFVTKNETFVIYWRQIVLFPQNDIIGYFLLAHMWVLSSITVNPNPTRGTLRQIQKENEITFLIHKEDYGIRRWDTTKFETRGRTALIFRHFSQTLIPWFSVNL